jgi:PAS domain S-box-containing protein
MDIRTKLVFALVAVALGSMAALALIMYTGADNALRESRLEELDGLAQAKKEALEEIFQGWADRVSLIASRTQLRLSLAEINQRPNQQAEARIQRILDDAADAVDVVESLTVHDLRGRLIASAGREMVAPPDPARSPVAVADNVFYEGTAAIGEGDLRCGFVANLVLDGQRVGDLQARLNARALLELVENRSGLGETGESYLVTRDTDGVARVLHRVRPEGPELWDVVELRGPGDPANLALDGEEGPRFEGLTDETGEPVWAAIAWLPEPGWGLVVQLSTREGREPVRAFREHLSQLALSLAAFGLVLGTILGLRFAKPIHDLAAAAEEIRGGNLSARANVKTQDEVGLLARTFDQMADELEEQVSLLKEFQKYFEVSLDMLCIAGTDGFFKRVNPAFGRILGWSEEELLSRSFMEFVHPDDQASTDHEIQKLSEGIPTISFENRYACSDGSYKHLLWNSYPDLETGLLYAIARDVTALKLERKETEAEIRVLGDRISGLEEQLRGAP